MLWFQANIIGKGGYSRRIFGYRAVYHSIDGIPRHEFSRIEGKSGAFEMVRLEVVEHVAYGRPVTHRKPEVFLASLRSRYLLRMKSTTLGYYTGGKS